MEAECQHKSAMFPQCCETDLTARVDMGEGNFQADTQVVPEYSEEDQKWPRPRKVHPVGVDEQSELAQDGVNWWFADALFSYRH